MKAGFPKTVKKEKQARGHYRLIRSDGYTREVKRIGKGWTDWRSGKWEPTLSCFIFDMKHGYTAYDQLDEEDQS